MRTNETKRLQYYLTDPALRMFVGQNMQQSLASVGFSKKFTSALVGMLSSIKRYSQLQEHYGHEIDTVYLDGFFQHIVPEYFTTHVIPEIPASKKVLDLGCGTGILAERLSRQERFGSIIGLELRSYPEWETFVNSKIMFTVADKDGALKLIEEERPDAILITWTLHHMPFSQQEEYLKKLYSSVAYGTRIIILEDTYAETLPPEHGALRQKQFMQLGKADRKRVMSVYDWIANRVLAKRARVPITFTYRTMEEWKAFLEDIGFTVIHQKFIGFPSQRDINTPQGLLVVEKSAHVGKVPLPKLITLQQKTGSEFHHVAAFSTVLSDPHVAHYIQRNFGQSLPTIGFSQSFVRDFLRLLKHIENYKSFREKHREEIHYVHSVVFFQHIVPDLFEKYVVPEIPKAKVVVDIGCGTGFLANSLAKFDRFQEIIGIDIITYPEWTTYLSKKVRFMLLDPDGFQEYIHTHRPDAVTITWTLQHLLPEQQRAYIQQLHAVLKKGAKLIILDDCYSETLRPKSGLKIYNEFRKFSRKDRDNIMYIYDWVANKILAQRDHATVQGSPYTTLEERERSFAALGFPTVKKVFIGFTKKRDTNTPLSMLVVKKK